MISTKQYLTYVEDHIKHDILVNELSDDINKEDLEVIQVWYAKTIQNHKGLFIIRNLITNTLYPYFIEATYNGNMGEIYLDYYTKEFKNIVRVNEYDA